jgi:hypothetical protein
MKIFCLRSKVAPPEARSPRDFGHNDDRIEHSPGNSLELLASTTSLTTVVVNEAERMGSVQVLTQLASNARLFRPADGRFCAQVPVGDRLEIYRLKSAAFRDWLIDGYVIDQPEAPSSWPLRRVIGMLEARARFSAGIPEVFVRVGHDGDRGDSPYFLDLGDPRGRAVAIDDGGWSVGRKDTHRAGRQSDRRHAYWTIRGQASRCSPMTRSS